MKPRVSVVIPTWNGRELLEQMLPSLAKQDYRDFTTVVVDNGSDDGTVDYLKKEWPDITAIALDRNHGFAPACNRGIGASGSDYVALLNNDLELRPDWLTEIVKAAERHPTAGSIASKMLDFYERTKIESVGAEMSWYATPTKRGEGETDRGQYDREEPIFGAVGGAVLYRRAAWDDVGPFDDDFFAYHEEADWSFRAQLRGWECWYTPQATVYHMGGMTSGRIGNWALYLTNRNLIWLVVKDFPASALLRRAPKLWFGAAKTLLGAIKERWLWTLAKAWGAALLGLPKMAARRRRIQRRRKAGTDRLDEVIRSDFPLSSKTLRKP